MPLCIAHIFGHFIQFPRSRLISIRPAGTSVGRLLLLYTRSYGITVPSAERRGGADGAGAGPQLRDQRVRRELAGRGPGRHAGRGVGGRGRAHGGAAPGGGARAVAHRGGAGLGRARACAAERRPARVQGDSRYS